MATVDNVLPGSLLDLLSNDLILRHTSPYIGVKSLLSLAATSKAYKSLVYDTPQVFQHFDTVGIGCLGESRHDVSIPIDDFFADRFRIIFALLGRNVIQDVRTLILDERFVPTTIIEEILCSERYQIRLLSLRAVNIQQKDVLRILRHLIRPSRPKGTPKLRGLYLFGHASELQEMITLHKVTERPEAIGITASMGAQLGAGNHIDYADDFRKTFQGDPYGDSLYSVPGMTMGLEIKWGTSEWPELLEACRGLIAFDAVLCRHNQETFADSTPRFATVRLTGCTSCGTCPEGPAYPGASPADHLPLLSPPPLHSSKVEVAQRIDTNDQQYPPLILRCRTCLKDRWCERCNVWWCESCYTVPKNRGSAKGSTVLGPVSKEDIKGAKKHCYECGQQCQRCQALTQRTCVSCPNQFCLEHDTGCSPKYCAWCNTGGRRGALLDY